MIFGSNRHRSIRYSIFIGVLAGSVFSGSGAFAFELSSIASLVAANDDIELEENGTYEAGAPEGGTYFGTYTGTLNGNGATITGLTAPLFNTISNEVKNLNLVTAPLVDGVGGVVGNGALANTLGVNGTINNVTVTGNVGSEVFSYVGGLVGSSHGTIIDSTMSGDVTGVNFVGGLVGQLELGATITNSHTTSDVTGTEIVGGLVGSSSGTIIGSTVTGDVTGNAEVGGLVGEMDSDASITNSILTSGNVTGTSYVGGLVGESHGGSIFTSTVTGSSTISGEDNVGGLIGELQNGTIFDSNVTGAVTVTGSGEYIGGLAGISLYGTINSSHAHADVIGGTSEGLEDHGTGGLVGYLGGPLIDSSATGTVIGFYEVGGLVGSTGALAEIINSHATGNVSGRDKVGGLVGYLDEYHPIIDSYATGNVSGRDSVGGLVGYSYYDADITDSYATGVVTGQGYYIGGLVGEAYGDITGSRHTTGTVTGYQYVGGLAGWSAGIDITDSRATGNVFGVFDVGGLVGYSDSNITDSRATGDVDGEENVGGLVGFSENGITDSYATGNVTGDYDLGGLVGDMEGGSVTNSYATGNVTGEDNLGGLVGDFQGEIANSYAIGHVTASGPGSSGNAGGLVGFAEGDITNSHASGDVSGDYDIGGLVGDLDEGSITNSYATGNVRATGTDSDWDNGWGGLVGESSGVISNSYATGNVVADYNYGSLIGYLMLESYLGSQIENSFATGSTSSATNGVQLNEGIYDEFGDFVEVPISELNGLGGFVGCTSTENDFSGSYSCLHSYKSFPETTPSILSVVNTVDDGGESAFEIVACKNNGLPSLSELIDSYANTCARERRIREFIQPTSVTEIAKALGFVLSPTFPNDAPIGFVKNENELAISKVLGVQKAANRVARTFVKTGEALQISYDFDGKDPIELWVKLPDGKWILAGVIRFDENGKAILPPIQFKVAGEYVVALNKLSQDSEKASAPLNQIGYLTVIVTNGDSV